MLRDDGQCWERRSRAGRARSRAGLGSSPASPYHHGTPYSVATLPSPTLFGPTELGASILRPLGPELRVLQVPPPRRSRAAYFARTHSSITRASSERRNGLAR